MVQAGELSDVSLGNGINKICMKYLARIIVDMSYPHLRGEPKVFGSVPLSCNAGIRAKDFPAEMSGTRSVVEILLRQGPGTTFCKQVSCDT